MARIRFQIAAALNKWRHRNRVSQSRFRMMDLASLADMPRGPGWFDSSWDLDQGLVVEIALPGDPPFQAWIEAQARAPVPAIAAAAPHGSTEDMLEFEPADWKSWAPPGTKVDPLPVCEAPALMAPAPKLELEIPELELELV